jgi:hypothetical protein
MTLYQFNAFDEMEQAEAVWSGNIGERQDEEHTILLYHLGSFYVEAYHHRECNVLRRFRSFSSADQLAPYLRHINFVDLLNGNDGKEHS